ncbi:YceI family protein [Parvicella tangerina]|uniref:Lipid/polyisoprenoid-binding YceI-like domain-containing protein n=1 Tax=Parvicella tangerina TaxID=2829795 RepID=A0A916N916_9FLAO|nr:YceI family protein [Parvicella tangerina]CAG5076291.1 hypothetical protein CRYO30217_00047 [Parvicella tangerina]
MKKFFYTVFAFAALTMVSCESQQEGEAEGVESENEAPASISGTYNTVDGSAITWKAKHYKDDEYVHVGTVPTAGNLVVDNNKIVGGEFNIDILNLDEEGDSEYNQMLEGHLQDSTFFNTAIYPTAKFTITGSEGNKVMGTLELIGIKTDVTLEGIAAFSEDEVTFEGSTTLDMLTFNMPFLIESEKATGDDKGQSPDPIIVVEVDMTFTK